MDCGQMIAINGSWVTAKIVFSVGNAGKNPHGQRKTPLNGSVGIVNYAQTA